MTNPLSQKTGIETIQPISMMAISGCFLPTILTTASARRMAPPVFSRKKPIIAPRMMTMPMLEKVPEKPAPIVPGISASGMPTMIASSSATPMMARKGCSFSLEIARIITTIAMTNVMRSGTPVIVSTSIQTCLCDAAFAAACPDCPLSFFNEPPIRGHPVRPGGAAFTRLGVFHILSRRFFPFSVIIILCHLFAVYVFRDRFYQ